MKRKIYFWAPCLTVFIGLVHSFAKAETLLSEASESGTLNWSQEYRAFIAGEEGEEVSAQVWSEAGTGTGTDTSSPADQPMSEAPKPWRNSSRKTGRVSARITARSGKDGQLFGYVGMPGEPAFGASVYEHALVEDEVRAGAREHWLDPAGSSDGTVTAGYTWRGMKLEGSAFRSHSGGESGADALKSSFGLTSSRLSFISGGHWALQVSRRQSSRMDDIGGTDSVRRTTVSATYRQALDNAEWKTTFAGGRISPSGDGPAGRALLCESVLTLAHAHSLFARWERAPVADIFNQDERFQGKGFAAEKFTFGYVYDLVLSNRSKLDLGIIRSQGASMSADNDIFNENRRSYKIFTRLTIPY